MAANPPTLQIRPATHGPGLPDWRLISDRIDSEVGRRRVRDHDEVRDTALQGLWTRSLNGVPGARGLPPEPGAALDAYIRITVRNARITLERRRAARSRADRAAARHERGDLPLNLGDELDRVWEVVDTLTGSERQVLRLHYERGLSERQIAKLWNVGRDTVHQLLTIALATLRARLDAPREQAA